MVFGYDSTTYNYTNDLNQYIIQTKKQANVLFNNMILQFKNLEDGIKHSK